MRKYSKHHSPPLSSGLPHMTVDQGACLGQAEGLLPKTVATQKSEECMCLVRCHVSGEKIPTMPPSMPWMQGQDQHPCVWLLDYIILPMAVLFGRIPFNLSAEKTDGMLNCILFDSVHCVFILFHQGLQILPLIHSSKMPPHYPITTCPSRQCAIWEKRDCVGFMSGSLGALWELMTPL